MPTISNLVQQLETQRTLTHRELEKLDPGAHVTPRKVSKRRSPAQTQNFGGRHRPDQGGTKGAVGQGSGGAEQVVGPERQS